MEPKTKHANNTRKKRSKHISEQAIKQASKLTYNDTRIIHVEIGLRHTFPKAIPGFAEVDVWVGRPQRQARVFKLEFHEDKMLVDVDILISQ